jgi:ADP-heptose:LPS heptosyltransferase
MLSTLTNPIAWLRSRPARRRVWRWLLIPLFRAVDATLLDAGELSAKGVHRILVLRPNHRLGNIILITPLIIELSRAFPGAEIDVLAAGDAALEILANFPCIRRIHTFPRRIAIHLPKVVKTMLRLRSARYDLVIDPVASSHTNRLLLYWLKPRRSAAIPSTPRTYVDRHVNWANVLPSAPRHFATLPVFLVRQALNPGHAGEDAHYPPLDLRLTHAERRDGRAILQAMAKRHSFAPGAIVIGVFADATGAKRLDAGWWLRFLGVLIEHDPRYAVIEFVPVDRRSRLEDRFPTYHSSGLRKLASVISNVSCFFSADGGVMHLACASGAPTIGLFSVTDPEKYGPYAPRNCSLDVARKSPEEAAQAAIAFLETWSNAQAFPSSAQPAVANDMVWDRRDM